MFKQMFYLEDNHNKLKEKESLKSVSLDSASRRHEEETRTGPEKNCVVFELVNLCALILMSIWPLSREQRLLLQHSRLYIHDNAQQTHNRSTDTLSLNELSQYPLFYHL